MSKEMFRILQFHICLLVLYKIICLQIFICILLSVLLFVDSLVCPQLVLYDILKFKTLGMHAAELPTTCTSGDCDQAWRERGISVYAAFRLFKRF